MNAAGEGLIPMTDAVWTKILRFYLSVYRGPGDEEHIRRELQGYYAVPLSGRVNVGRFIRYMRKGVLDNELKRGGYVVKCNTKTIHLEDNRRKWRISRHDNYIFVGSAVKKDKFRLETEEFMRRNEERRAQLGNQLGNQSVRARFVE